MRSARPLPVAVIVSLWLCAAKLAGAQAPAAALAQAQAHFLAGEYGAVPPLTEPLVADETTPRADRAEAYRLLGLAYFLLARADESEAALLEFLKLEPDAHLDPALVPPEAVSFFEGVRARHAGELRRYRVRPKSPSLLVAVVPLAAQLQNHEPGKAWALGATGGLFLVTNVTTYLMLEDLCGRKDGTCGEACDPTVPGDCDGKDKADLARTLRTVNRISGVAFIGVMAYGIVDGVLGYRRHRLRERGPTLTFVPVEGGGALMWGGRF